MYCDLFSVLHGPAISPSLEHHQLVIPSFILSVKNMPIRIVGYYEAQFV
jgi:hypothetical protein